MSKFTVIEVPWPDPGELISRLGGVIDKYWVEVPSLGQSLIKNDPHGAWIEKVTATLAERVGLPTASYELGQMPDGSKTVISPSFLLAGAVEIPGEQLLKTALGENYKTLDAILSVVDRPDIALPSSCQPPVTISNASDLLAGYLMFDSWIGNVDRHNRNWGIQRTLDGRRELLPVFDHGRSLGGRGVKMPEDKLPPDIASFSANCHSAIQGEVGGNLTMERLASRLLALKPEAAGSWIERIATIDHMTIQEIVDRIPEGWVGDVRKKFAIDFLDASRDRLVLLLTQTR